MTASIVTHELVNAAAAALVLTLTAPWWEPVFGIAAPAWMFAPLALRAAALAALTTFTIQGRLLATLAVLLDAMVTLPLVALVGRSLEAVVFVSTTITLILLVLAAYSPRMQKIAESKTAPSTDRWRLGDWLSQLGKDLQLPFLVAVAGIAIVVPLTASATLASLMLAPFMAAAAVRPSEWFANRVVRGMIVAAIGWAFVHACGPAIYRFLLPEPFGDGALLTTFAWSALACIPIALMGEDDSPSQRRKLIGALLGTAVLVALTVRGGAVGCLLGIALAPVFAARMWRR
jgi:hypothetical protein